MATPNTSQVYFHPKQLEFFMDDVNSHKAIASLFNPYEFPIKFKAPKKYTVTDPEGFVNPKTSVNLIVKHGSQAFQSENVIDKLRIQVYQMSGGGSPKPNLLGKRDIPLYSVVSRENHVLALMTKSKAQQQQINDSSEDVSAAAAKYALSSFAYGNNLNDMMASINLQKNALQMQQPVDNVNYLVILLGVVCLGILFLPLTGTTDSYLPAYLHTTHEIKLVSTFILGMVTMVILKA